MAEDVATFFLEKLAGQLQQEAQLLRGVKAEVESVKGELESMKAFLKDADQKRGNTYGVEAWVKEVRLLVFAVEDVVDEYMLQIERNINPSRGGIMGCLTSYACFFKDLISRHRTGTQIQKIKEDIKQIDERRKRYDFQILLGARSGTDESERGSRVTYAFVEEADIVGIDSDKKKIEKWVFKPEEGGRRSVISIVGMGGSGKTTLVKKIFNNVKNRFYCHAWVSVSKSNKTTELLKDIMKGFYKSNTNMPSLVENENIQEHELIRKIYTSLQSERRQFILVLDDIWDTGVWESLKPALPHGCGGKIIFTTRIMDVANPISENYYVHKIQPLSFDLAWELFCKKTFKNSNPRGVCPPELKDLGKGIVKKCKGLPLAVVAIGGLLSKKGTNPSQWRDILQNLDSELIENPNLQGLNKALLLSYNYLPYYLRYCFLYCGLFPEDYEIKREKVTLLWVAEGFIHDRRRHNTKTMEEVADDYFIELIDRNMLQVADVNEAGKVLSCKVHDLMRELAIDIAAKENFGAICCGTQDDRVLEEERPRRMSVHDDWDNIPTNVGKLKPRTILVFENDGLFDPVKNRRTLPSSLTLLSVLDLQGVKMDSLSVVVCDHMIHLRYLGLAFTLIKLLPPSIGKLRRLQTLDIWKTKVECLPPSINMLHQLRHLFLDQFYITEIPTSGIGNLRCMQTLKGVIATPGIVTELGNFTQLTTLHVRSVTEEVCQELCASVKKMSRLRSLEIIQRDEKQSAIQLETLSPPPLYLDELKFKVPLERLPDWVGSLNSLTLLELSYCRLIEDPLSILQHLPQLIYLGLGFLSHIGKRMGGCGSTGFPKLRRLFLNGLPLLEEVGRIEEGAMPCLEHFQILKCQALKILPQGIEHLTSLKHLDLWDVDQQLIDNAKELFYGRAVQLNIRRGCTAPLRRPRHILEKPRETYLNLGVSYSSIKRGVYDS